MNRRAYSLVEVLIAGGLLVIGIAAAALLANSMFLQEVANARVTTAINMQEQAARLYQLGLSPSTITNILPARCVSTDPPGSDAILLQFTESTDTVVGLGDVETAACRVVFPAAVDTDNETIYRTNDITVVRPSISQ